VRPVTGIIFKRKRRRVCFVFGKVVDLTCFCELQANNSFSAHVMQTKHDVMQRHRGSVVVACVYQIENSGNQRENQSTRSIDGCTKKMGNTKTFRQAEIKPSFWVYSCLLK
jgi:hypothetical protein